MFRLWKSELAVRKVVGLGSKGGSIDPFFRSFTNLIAPSPWSHIIKEDKKYEKVNEIKEMCTAQYEKYCQFTSH